MSEKLVVGLLKADYTDRNLRAKIKSYVEKLNDLHLDVFVAPEYSFFNDKSPMPETEFKQEIKELTEKTNGKHALVLPGTFIWYDKQDNLYNTLPIIQTGKVVLNYDKKESGGEYELAASHQKQFQPGSTSGVFGLSTRGKKLEAGVEICADHGSGILKNENGENLDLQFIVSAGVYLNNDNLALKRGGYALLCDGASPRVKVLKRLKNGLNKEVMPARVENNELYVYELALAEETSEKYFWNVLFKIGT